MFEGTIGDYIGQAVAHREALGRGERPQGPGTFRTITSPSDEAAVAAQMDIIRGRGKSRAQARKEARLRVQAQKYGLGSVIQQIIAAGGKVPKDMRLAAFGPAEVAERASKREAKTARMQYGQPVLQAMRDVAALGNAELMAALPPRERQRLLQGTGRGVGDLIASGGGLGQPTTAGVYDRVMDVAAERPDLEQRLTEAVKIKDGDSIAEILKYLNVPKEDAVEFLQLVTGLPGVTLEKPTGDPFQSWQKTEDEYLRSLPSLDEMLTSSIPIVGPLGGVALRSMKKRRRKK
jgi:hypothetical protein